MLLIQSTKTEVRKHILSLKTITRKNEQYKNGNCQEKPKLSKEKALAYLHFVED